MCMPAGTARGARPARLRCLARSGRLALLLLAGLLGCSAGQIELASLDYRAIDPPAAKVTRIELDRGYWWSDEQGRVWFAAARSFAPLLFPQFRVDLKLSLRLDQPPAGAARNYGVDRGTMRAVLRVGPAELRLVSVSGVIAAYREAGEQLRLSGRLLVTQQAAQLLGGYSNPARNLLLCRIHAVQDAQRGRAIADETETQGWERSASTQPATTQPAKTQPASARAIR